MLLFPAHHDSILSLGQEHCYCYGCIALLKLESKAAHTNHHDVPGVPWQLGSSMLFAVENTVALQCFDVVGWLTGRASGLSRFCHNGSKKFPFGD